MIIYCVKYSEEAGYYVAVEENVNRVSLAPVIWSGNPSDPDSDRSYLEGWREYEEDAVAFWVEEGIKYAAQCRAAADQVEAMVRDRVPARLNDPILRPVL